MIPVLFPTRGSQWHGDALAKVVPGQPVALNWPSVTPQGLHGHGNADGTAWNGTEWNSTHGMELNGMGWQGMEQNGTARMEWHSMARHGMRWDSIIWQGTARHRTERHGMAQNLTTWGSNGMA